MRSTNVRHAVLLATTLAAFLMYLDRVCIGWVLTSESFQSEVSFGTGEETTPEAIAAARTRGNDHVKEAFFWAYALAQVPAGWLAERFGKRLLMSVMILLWSAFTALTSFAEGVELLLVARIGCGLAQAGAYPIATSLISRWVNFSHRGIASSVVSLGGRLGGAMAPRITFFVVAYFCTWRAVGWIYGTVGIAVAAAFWFVFRERPEQHPQCNAAEVAYLAADTSSQDAAQPPGPFPLMAVLRSGSLWLMCAVQFLTNVGWSFIIHSLPLYFKDVLKLSDNDNTFISTATIFLGFFGLIAGGIVTDFTTRKYGKRLGCMVPIVVTRFLAAFFFVLCLTTNQPWLLAICLGLMAFSTDAGVPAMWTYTQDVGGRQIAPVMGWANMWGNFGAALQPRIITAVNLRFDANGDYHEAFLFSAGAFALAGVLSLGINAARPLVAEDPTA